METDRVFRGSIPALYDQYLGPMIFSPYANDLAAKLANLEHGPVLEIAARTGVVTRALVSTLPLGVSIASSIIDAKGSAFEADTGRSISEVGTAESAP